MGFLNGATCVILLVGPMLICDRLTAAPSKAVLAGFLAYAATELCKIALPLPDVARPIAGAIDVVALMLLLTEPRIKRSALFNGCTGDERRGGTAMGWAYGRFAMYAAAVMWHAVGLPGFTAAGVASAAMLSVNFLHGFALVRLAQAAGSNFATAGIAAAAAACGAQAIAAFGPAAIPVALPAAVDTLVAEVVAAVALYVVASVVGRR